ncbi:MAG: bifunctional 4-hydroxy-2-oxoglutarate aldolase/2-dehydro-3-deoxy-phosphogluconate aldolase [Desulfobacterales bacterium]|nr:bifunctional 4-hydroxy-2-oxoglutarate aldolase/2-dehydro-3-deoxy-phosphogluconate aldolase [Desulfobacterales bacterium]MDJ0874191.1 bifunctional 4-hydroxy-2-oxoglutarate aldolase/2-dehydro-3-deoxy-phosphogluconate aldolase [Desulfobacterales bacterium]
MSNAKRWKLAPLDVLNAGPVVPVIVIKHIEQAVPLAKALLEGGVKVLEVTLRSAAAIEAIRLLSREVPEAIVGAGTVASRDDLAAVTEAGAVFAISPGLTPSLLEAANQGPIALIPGIATASELMLGMEMGYTAFKFFPAEAAGGVPMLKSIGGPFPHVTFCPTGGVSQANFNAYLALANVACVGGSWIVPSRDIETGNWEAITRLAAEAVAMSRR